MAERLASFISGGGTTMEQIGLAYKRKEIPIKLVLVISSTPKAGGIEKAGKLGIPHVVVNPDDFRGEDQEVDQEGFGLKLRERLRDKGVTAITQNGWLPLTPENVIDEYRDTIFNQHPGPKEVTGKTKGIQPHAIVLYIARHTGRNEGTEVITHRVTPKFDEGPTVGITPVPIHLPHDYAKRLQRRALPKEHQLRIELLKQLARGDVKEVSSPTQYIKPGEEKILRDARAYARKRYPEG